MTTKQTENQLEVDFEDIADKLYTIDEDGNIFKLNKLDFDNKENQNLNKTKTGVSNGRSSVLPEIKKRSKSDSMATQNIETRDIESSEEYEIRKGDEDEEDEEEEESKPSKPSKKKNNVAKSVGNTLLNKVLSGASSKKDVSEEELEEEEENEEDEEDMTEDLTNKQVEENYWKETEARTIDTSTLMMEARIHKCMEANPNKSREECSKEVKTRMKKEGSENTKTDTKEEVDMVEICPKKLDTLEQKAKKYDELMTENAKLKGDLESFKNDFLEIKKAYEAKKAADIEAERQAIIKELKTDFVLSEDVLKPKTIEQLRADRDILRLALSAKKITEEKPATEDFQYNMDIMTQREKELDSLYKIKIS